MATFSEYTEQKKKKKKGQSFADFTNEYLEKDSEEDIAPVKTSAKTEERTGLLKSGRFADGYDVGDVSLSMLASSVDLSLGIWEGAGNMAEGITDFLLHGVAKVSDLAGADEFADKTKKAAEKNSVSNLIGGIREKTGIKDSSIYGDFGYGVAQGLGQMATVIATGGLGELAGLGTLGTTILTSSTMGVSSMGSGISEAYQGGATDEEAWSYGAMKGAIDAGTELIFGGLGKGFKALGVSKGLSSADDLLAKKLSSKISSQFFKNATEYGVKATAEGVEELLAGLGSAAAKKLTYMSDEEIGQLVKDENLLEQFATGVIVSGIAQGGDFASSTRSGRDFVSGLTANEEKVVQAEFESRVAAEEQNGKKLNKKQKNKIYDEVIEDLKKGGISTDTIGKMFGGEDYKAYKSILEQEKPLRDEIKSIVDNDTLSDEQRDILIKDVEARLEALAKETNKAEVVEKYRNAINSQFVRENGKHTQTDDYLLESYNEDARRGQYFEVDLDKYDGKAKEFMQKLMDSKLANNTRRSHEYFDLAAKIVGDQDMNIDVVDNKTMLELIKKKKGDKFDANAYKGKIVNGFEIDGGIAINIKSAKALSSLIGHEITHSFEKSKSYEKLKNAALQYARTKGVYESLFEEQKAMYEGVYANDESFTEKVDREVVSEVVGDYLFTDPDFISHLSTKHRNVFLKVFDEIKYLCKIATKGSKEARQLEKVKRAFEKVYRENIKGETKATAPAKASNKVESKAAKEDIAPTMEEDVAPITEDVAEEDLFSEVVAEEELSSEEQVLEEVEDDSDERFRKFLATEADLEWWQKEFPNVSFDTEDTWNTHNGARFYDVLSQTEEYKNYEQNPSKNNKNKLDDVRRELTRKVYEHLNDQSVDVKTAPSVETQNTQAESTSSPLNREYMETINRGDMKTAKRMVKEAAWKAGFTEKVYHGTNNFGFTKIDLSKTENGVALFTSDSEETVGTYSQNGKIKRISDKDGRSGIYEMYANTDNFLEVECNGSYWNKIKAEGLPEGIRTTENIARYARDEGYSGVKFKNVRDGGSKQDISPATVYAFFDPQTQVKSADTVTYDDKGNVIPLSERFNTKNDDIRYSLSAEQKENMNGAEYNGKEFWLAVADLKGNIVKTWTYDEAEAIGFDAESEVLFNDKLKDGYRFFTTELIEDNGRIEYDDYGEPMPEDMVKRINEQIKVKTSTEEATLPEKIRKLHDEIGTLNKRLSNVTQWVDGARDLLVQRANNQITFEEYESRLRKDSYYRRLDDERQTLRKEMDGLVAELEKLEGKPWKELKSSVLYRSLPRYSLSTDSEGNDLTVEQREFFKDTKALDRDGNLLKVYHTTNNDFTVFDKERKGEATGDTNTYLGFFFADDAEYMQNFPEFENGKTEAYYLNMTNPIDMTNISKEAFIDIVEVLGGDVNEAAEIYDQEFSDEQDRAMLRGDNNTSLQLIDLLNEMTGDADYRSFIEELKPHYDELMSKGYDGVVNYLDELWGAKEYIVLDSNQAKLTSNLKPTSDPDVRYSISTEREPMPKTSVTVDPTKANLQKDIKTVRAVRTDTMLKNGYTTEDVDEVNRFMDNLADFMEKAGVTYKFIGLEDVNNAKLKVTYDKNGNPKKVTMSAMVKNGEYPINFDFTRICKKRESMSMVIKELAKRQTADGRRTIDTVNLDAKALWTINEELRKAGLETACLGCFVESKRYNIQAFADKAVNMWNSIVDEVRQENGAVGEAESFNFAEGINLDRVDYGAIEKIFADYQTVKGRTSPEARMRALIQNGGELFQRYLKPSDLMTPEGIESIKAMSTKKNDFYGILKGVYGQAAPKEVMGFSPYNSEVALLPKNKNGKKLSEYVASIGGVRMQSFSDFLVANVYDYMQMVADLSARHLPAHAYTKEIAFAKIFGMTGIKINMSVMFDIDANLPGEYAGLQFVADENGDEYYEGVKGRWEYLVGDKNRSDATYEATGERPYVQSIGFDEAVALQNDPRYSKNCGIIGVGMSDRHILKMLDDGRIRYIIPYHSSSLPAVIAEVTNIKMATDYTDFQNTRKITSITDANGNVVDLKALREQCNSWSEVYSLLQENIALAGWKVETESDSKLAGRGGFDIYKDVEATKNPKKSAENYLQYCAENNYMPVFEQFAFHENYYKLLYDFDPYDSVTGEYSPQTEVKNIYSGYNPSEGLTSTETVQKIIDDEMAKQNEINKARNEAMPSVVNNVLEQLGVEHNEVGVSTGDMAQSLSWEGETPKTRHRNDVFGKDIMYEAPIREDIAKNTTTIPEGEDIAPTTEAPDNPQIKTVKDRLTEKLQNIESDLSDNQLLREWDRSSYDHDIEKAQAKLDAMKDKNCETAVKLKRRIERLQKLKERTDETYAKRISRLEARAEKTKEEIRTGKGATEQRMMRTELHGKIVDDIKAKFSKNGLDFDETLKNAKNLSTFATVDNTPQRVLEKSLGYKEGQILADETVNKVAQNETEGIKWLNSFTDRKNGLLAKISKQYNIKPGSKESAAAQMYAEGFYVDDNNNLIKYGDEELAKDFPNSRVQENIKGLARDERIRKIYDDTLKAINESRTRNAYPEIPRLENYFLHFRAMDDTFSRIGLPFNPNDIKAKDLPTDLNGVTADLKPGQPYFASAMHRKGKRTSFDLLGGLERYLSSAKNQIYHIDDIQTLRALRNYIADTYGQANGLEGLDALSEEEAQERIKQVYNSHLSTFAKFLNEEANIIAGKTALIDRGLEGIIGRRGITFLDTINKQVGANMVGFNVSSSLTNFLAGVQATAKTNKLSVIKSLAQTTSSKIGSIFGKTDSFVESNPTIIRRKGADRFYRTPYQKAADAGYVLMSAVDNVTTEFIVRAKYDEFIKKGMSEEQAILEADKWTSRLMADRSLGQMPQLYNSKMLGLVTKFQLEVRNQLDSQFYDTIQEAKASNEDIENGFERNAKTAAKVTATFFELAVLQHLFGKAFESVAGYNPAFDIIDVLIKTLGLDDDEDDEDTVLDNVEEGFLALLEDLPYTSTFTGGRIPISSALPISELIKGEDEYGNEKSRLETMGEIAPYYVLPGGYGQVKKTVQGLSMFDEDLPISGSYTDSGNLRFPVEDTLANRVQAGIFGQWANENARDYFDNDYAPLNKKQTQEFIDVDIPIKDYREYREGLSEYDTLDEKADYIANLDLPISKKNLLINNIANRKDDIDLTDYDEYGNFEEFDFAQDREELYGFLKENNISFKQYMSSDKETKEAYAWASKNPDKYTLSKAIASDVVVYKRYAQHIYDLEADKDENGNFIRGSKKEKVIDYINSLNADYGEKIILFKSAYKSDDTYNYDIIEYLNNRNDISYEEMIAILKELGFTVESDGRTVTW